jgi:glycosyltransferase involved in cell wall biosynthesis
MISVLLPYRDAAAHLDEALGSILSDGAAGEVVAIDDGSRDDGPAIVARHAARDRRVVMIATGGVGVAEALARGLAVARGELIARMDADDVSLPGRLAAERRLLDGDARLGAVGVRVEGFPSIGNGLASYLAWQNGLTTPEEHARDLFVEAPLCHPSVLVRRAALDDVGGWRRAPWAEDYDLWLRLDARGWTMAKVPEVLFRWRHRPGRATFAAAECAPARLVEARAAYLAPRLGGRRFVVWGAGQTGKRLARALEAYGARPEAFVDIDPRKIGRPARAVHIVDADGFLAAGPRAAPFVVVAVGTRGAREIVRGRLVRAGFVEGAGFVCAA